MTDDSVNNDVATTPKAEEQCALRLLQGYLWHPQSLELELDDYLPTNLLDNVHILWDAIRPPFTFFDDGTLSSSQVFYQLTVIYVGDNHDNAYWETLLQQIHQQLQPMLEATPAGVGWQLLGDLRPL